MSNLPDRLYRYRGLSGDSARRVQRTIETGKQYFASPLLFNDPFDCRPNFMFDGTDEQVRNHLNGMYSRRAPELGRTARRQEVRRLLADPKRDPRVNENLAAFADQYHNAVTAKIGVLCLSAVNDNILMWSHYADAHHGICLSFNTDHEVFALAQPVRYRKRRPVVNPVLQSNDEMLDNALYTKSDHWSYEEEWRLQQYERGQGEYTIPVSCLTEIILGGLISEGDRTMVAAWAAACPSKPKVIPARISKAEFKVLV